jgi:cell division protein ZapE
MNQTPFRDFETTMQTSTPLARYEQALSQGEFRPDDVQREAITRLDALQQALVARQQSAAPATSGLLGRLSKLIGKEKNETPQPVRGLYMWGGVGRGKTWVMDQSIPGDRKLRLHFHRFMLRVHEELTQLQGQSDPLLIIADRFKAETDILCFDEFFVSDITDAMLLGTLMEALFERGIALVATSNIPPDDLYRNGLQRARFLPAIEQIKRHCDVMNVDAGIDYRLRTLTSAHLWNSPLNGCLKRCRAASLKMRRFWKLITARCRRWASARACWRLISPPCVAKGAASMTILRCRAVFTVCCCMTCR